MQDLISVESLRRLETIDQEETDFVQLCLEVIDNQEEEEALDHDLFPLMDSLLHGFDSSSDVNDNDHGDMLQVDDSVLHPYTRVKTLLFCRRFLSLIRESNICKTKSNAYLKLIHTILPHPNN